MSVGAEEAELAERKALWEQLETMKEQEAAMAKRVRAARAELEELKGGVGKAETDSPWVLINARRSEMLEDWDKATVAVAEAEAKVRAAKALEQSCFEKDLPQAKAHSASATNLLASAKADKSAVKERLLEEDRKGDAFKAWLDAFLAAKGESTAKKPRLDDKEQGDNSASQPLSKDIA